MALLNLDAFDATPLAREPFPYVVVPNFIRQEAFTEIVSDFPEIAGPGSFPLGALELRGSFRAVLDELEAHVFQQAVERKFEIDLSDRPKIITIRGHARQKDGAIHTDSATKLISVLLYMNADWAADGGRLRLLRTRNLADSVAEIPPVRGTLVAFRRSPLSWHGHKPYAGPRRVIQLNWMVSEDVAAREDGRHRVAALFKTMSGFFGRRTRM